MTLPYFWTACSLAIASFPLLAALAQAEIVPDATLPQPSQVPSGCTHCLIQGGTVRGENLFHSFREFSIPTGGTAWFQNTADIRTILTRVTGHSASLLDGLLKVNGRANLFFLNPNGILFGPNARLEVAGSFVASTADRVLLPDGNEFSARHPQAPPLLAVNLTPGLQRGRSDASATIVNRGQLVAGEDLILEADHLDLQGHLQAGRNLTLQAQSTLQIRDTATAPFLARSQGNLTLQGDRGIDIVVLNHPGHSFQSGGDLRLISNGDIAADAHFAGQGNFLVQTVAGQPGRLVSRQDPVMTMQGDVDLGGFYGGASLQVNAGGNITYGVVVITAIDPAVHPSNPAFWLNAGGRITGNGGVFTALPGLLVNFQSQGHITTQEMFTNGGSITLNSQAGRITANRELNTSGAALSLTANGTIETQALTTLAARGGDLTLTSRTGSITATGAIGTFGLSGSGGTVQITAPAGQVTLTDVLNNFSLENGNGGRTTIAAGQTIRVQDVNTFSATGNGGSVQLVSRQGAVIANAIDTVARTNQASGAINVTADRGITVRELRSQAIQGTGGNITLAAENGNITLDRLFTFTRSGRRAGTVQAMTQHGDITVKDPLVTYAQTGRAGDVILTTQQGNITIDSIVADTRTGHAGQVQLTTRAGNIRSGDILSNALTGTANDITLTAQGQIQINGGLLAFSRQQQGGNLRLTASDSIQTGSLNTTGSQGSGNITIVTQNTFEPVPEIRVNGTRRILPVISSDTFGAGPGGNIQIQARQVRVQGGAQISASTHGTGRGGNIAIVASDAVLLSGVAPSGVIPGITISAGVAGLLEDTYLGGYIPTGDTAQLTDPTSERTLFPSGIFTQTTIDSRGNAGTIAITTPQLRIERGGTISASTFGQGNAGGIDLRTPHGSTWLNHGAILSGVAPGSGGRGGAVRIQTPALTIQNGGLIQTQTLGRGGAGNVAIVAEQVTITGFGTAIRSGSGNSSHRGTIGPGGDIALQTSTLRVTQGGTIDAQTDTHAQGGTINITADRVQLDRQGQLRTSSSSRGSAGNINLAIRDRLQISQPETGLFADTTVNSSGVGGSITVMGGHTEVQNGATIAVDSQGSGLGGSISITGQKLVLSGGGALTAEANSAQGGNITITTEEILFPRDRGLISATAGKAQGAGNGGNITISAPFLLAIPIDNTDIIANAFTGQGGRIQITANGIYGFQFQPQLTANSDITASSQFGLSGTIVLNTLDIDPSRGLVALPLTLVDPSHAIRQDCVAGKNRASAFVTTGRGGIPQSPNQPLRSPTTVTPWVTVAEANVPTDRLTIAPQTRLSPVEPATSDLIAAQAWRMGADRTVYLVSDPASPLPLTGGIPASPCSASDSPSLESRSIR